MGKAFGREERTRSFQEKCLHLLQSHKSNQLGLEASNSLSSFVLLIAGWCLGLLLSGLVGHTMEFIDCKLLLNTATSHSEASVTALSS